MYRAVTQRERERKKKKNLRINLGQRGHFSRGGRVERRCWVNFQCRGVLLVWMTVGQGPIALAVGAGRGLFGHFFSHLSSLFFLPLFGRLPDIDRNTVSKGRETQNNQPTNQKPLFIPYMLHAQPPLALLLVLIYYRGSIKMRRRNGNCVDPNKTDS